MNSVYRIRQGLSGIRDLWYESDPEPTGRGDLQGIECQTLWAPEPQDGTVHSAPMDLESAEDDSAQDNAPDPFFEVGPEVDLSRSTPILSSAKANEILRAVRVTGVEAMAWYVTFHALGTQWGIYIPVSSILVLAAQVFGGLEANLDVKLRLAFRALHQHEAFHFAADYFAAQWEAITLRPCHKPSRALRDPVRSYNIREEMLANAQMLRAVHHAPRALKIAGKTDALREWTKQMGPGYRDGHRITRRTKFEAECQRLGCDYVNSISGYNSSRVDLVDHFRFLSPSVGIDWRLCPIHIVHDEHLLHPSLGRAFVDLIQRVTGIQETPGFLKDFAKLSLPLQRRWGRVKHRLSIDTTATGVDFKFWAREKDELIFSVDLDRNFRVHIALDQVSNSWRALAVGNHKKMGHG